MLKKILLVVALLALMAPATFARTYLHQNGTTDGTTPVIGDPNLAASTPNWEYDSNNSERTASASAWPATYTPVDACVIPVKMDVGFWFKVNGASTLVLKLKQRDIHSYTGSVTFGVVTNSNMALTVAWAKASDVDLGNYGHSESVSPSTLAPTNGNAVNVTITETLTNVDLSKLSIGGQDANGNPTGSATDGTCKQVGTVTLRVAPNFSPVLVGGCSN